MFYARKETADEQDDVILNKPLIELKWYGGTSNMHKVVLFFFSPPKTSAVHRWTT